MNEFSKLDTPRGSGARSMTTLSPSSVHVNFDGSGASWQGPLTPVIPVAPPETAGRAFDYQPGYNLVARPRANEPITFPMLRAMAEGLDVLRLVIETRKNQMARQRWTVRIKHEGNSRRPSAAALSPSVRSTIRDVTEFLKAPSFGVPWSQWLRMILEDHYVIDAPAMYCLRSRSGALLELQVTDGSMIKRIIGPDGRTPRPIPWDGRSSFDWNGLQITPENYHTQGFKGPVNGFLLPPCYQQFLHGVAASDLTQQDLIYAPMNLRSHGLYGFSPVEQIVNTINTAMRRAASQLEYFREGNQPDAFFAMPKSWTPDQIGRYQEYFDAMLSGNLARRRNLKFIAGGSKTSYIPTREPPLKNDFDEWIARIICYAFSIPPTPFMALANRSIAEEHSRSAEEEGLQNTKLFISDLINSVITDEFVPDGSIQFGWEEEEEINQAEQSKILARLVETGIMTANEARDKLGQSPDPSPAASTLMVRTAAGYQPLGGASKPTIGETIDT